MGKDTFYFSHDYNSRNDAKVKKLIAKHGFLGYGLFWAIIEDLYNNANALPMDYETIAFDLRVDKKVIESVINDFDLFVFDGDFFGSLSVENRLNERNKKSVKARESALKRWNKDANALPTQSECNAIKESKGKETKGNEIKENIREQFFKDLENSSHIETISRDNKAPVLIVKKHIELFRPNANVEYRNFVEFVNHFKNWFKKQYKPLTNNRNQYT